MSVESIYGFVANTLVLAPGSITQIGKLQGMNAANIKIAASGASGLVEINSATGLTIEVGGFTVIAGTASVLNQAGPTFGNGYPISSSEIVSVNLGGIAYLYCSGSTCTVNVLFGRSQGF